MIDGHHVQGSSARCGMQRGRSRALTLVEIVISITIILVLISAVVVTGKMTRDASRRMREQQQLSMLANAINQYASFWPAWKLGTTPAAERGWPDYIAGRLFGAPYDVIAGFNDYVNLYAPPASADNILNANECLFYCLTAPVGKGPFLQPDATDGRQDALGAAGQRLLYPALTGSARIRQRLVDVWGTPYRYFWVYRDPLAYRGYLPILTADPNDLNFRVAIGFVLESAGPDKKYGNVWQWKTTITQTEIIDATDNLTILP